MISVHAKKLRLRSADFRRILRSNTFLNRKSALCGRIFFASTEIMHAPKSNFPLHFDIENIHQICTGKLNDSAQRLLPATLLERWPQICRVEISCELLQPLRSFPQTNSMKCFVNWIALNSHVRLNKTQPCLNVAGYTDPLFFFYQQILN